VRDFGAVADDETDDEPAISKAIEVALGTSHRVVYIPEGTWHAARGIALHTNGVGPIVVTGAHSKRTRLRWMSALNYPMFGVRGGVPYFEGELRNMTLDGRGLPRGGGHGVRSGNGWDSGYLHLDGLNIVHPGCYGVGIQNHEAHDKPVRGLRLTRSYVAQTGSDGIDFKAPPGANNYDVVIHDVLFENIGGSPLALGKQKNYDGSDAAIDITADGFHISRVSIITNGQRRFDDVWHENDQRFVSGTNYVEGIRLRTRGGSWDEPAARNGKIEGLFVRGANSGVFFEGWNRNVTISRSKIESVRGSAIYLRGTGHTVGADVCAIEVGRPIHVSAARGGESGANNQILGPGSNCPPQDQIGAIAAYRDANGWIDVASPMDCHRPL
jgi:hypothetical protein